MSESDEVRTVDPQREAVRQLYGQDYARAYEEIWQRNELWVPEAEHHVRTLRELVDPAERWLDVGCGTGYFLSQFPGVERAGVDLSPSMLERARANNPDALFFREGDIVDDVEEWHGAWDLVTCTGQPWSYCKTMDEIRQVVANIAAWTAPGGVAMLQPGDLTDLNGCRLDYDFGTDRPAPGTTRITGAIWSHWEEDFTHLDMIWPSLDVWVKWFAEHFADVEVIHWPWDPPPPILHWPRRVIIARAKRAEGDDSPATIHYQAPDLSPLDAVAPHDMATDPDPETPVPAVPAVPAIPGKGERLPKRRLYHQPVSYLVSRLKPWDPRFWGAVGKRVRPRVEEIAGRRPRT